MYVNYDDMVPHMDDSAVLEMCSLVRNQTNHQIIFHNVWHVVWLAIRTIPPHILSSDHVLFALYRPLV